MVTNLWLHWKRCYFSNGTCALPSKNCAIIPTISRIFNILQIYIWNTLPHKTQHGQDCNLSQDIGAVPIVIWKYTQNTTIWHTHMKFNMCKHIKLGTKKYHTCNICENTLNLKSPYFCPQSIHGLLLAKCLSRKSSWWRRVNYGKYVKALTPCL